MLVFYSESLKDIFCSVVIIVAFFIMVMWGTILFPLENYTSDCVDLCYADFPWSPENKHLLPADRKPGEEPESLVGKQVEYVTDNGLKRTGLVIFQVPAKPTVYYIKYDDDVHIHVYDLVKTT